MEVNYVCVWLDYIESILYKEKPMFHAKFNHSTQNIIPIIFIPYISGRRLRIKFCTHLISCIPNQLFSSMFCRFFLLKLKFYIDYNL